MEEPLTMDFVNRCIDADILEITSLLNKPYALSFKTKRLKELTKHLEKMNKLKEEKLKPKI